MGFATLDGCSAIETFFDDNAPLSDAVDPGRDGRMNWIVGRLQPPFFSNVPCTDDRNDAGWSLERTDLVWVRDLNEMKPVVALREPSIHPSIER